MPPEAPSCGPKTIAAIPVAALAFVGWVVALGGLANVVDECEDVPGFDCNDVLAAHWWSLFFELFVLIVLGVLACVGWVSKARMLLLVFLGMVSVHMTDSASFFLVRDVLLFQEDLEEGAEAAAAGFIIMTFANFAMLVMLGLEGIWNCNFRIRISTPFHAQPQQPQPTGPTPPPGVVVGSTQPPDAPIAVESITS